MKYKGLPCAWCGGKYLDGAHVPTRFLISKDDRMKLKGEWPVLPSCKNCNQELKLDEEWFAVHFASILYDFSPNAKNAFDGHITKHLKKNISITRRYHNYLQLVDVEINGKKIGTKTKVELSTTDSSRLHKVAEMFSRGLHYVHTGKSAKILTAKTVYIKPELWNDLVQQVKQFTLISLFPGTFEYSYGVTETGESVFIIYIFGKPSYCIYLVTPERDKKMKEKEAKGLIKKRKYQNFEILG